mmetsp:Transcript_12648/g.12433  ORF Transcript_12648/g.12433 Transcript_12648/m.12433 type:complete len:131 (-) Transcript_12648:43-435(-)
MFTGITGLARRRILRIRHTVVRELESKPSCTVVGGGSDANRSVVVVCGTFECFSSDHALAVSVDRDQDRFWCWWLCRTVGKVEVEGVDAALDVFCYPPDVRDHTVVAVLAAFTGSLVAGCTEGWDGGFIG